MSMLHTINKSPFMNTSLTSCLRIAQDGNAILFIEDGVYAVLKGTEVSSAIEEATRKFKVYALSPDLAARGVQDRVIDGVELVDYDGFVDLTVEYPKVHAWL
jgi:tRNA 2-thiouridine synthesizing protein B